MIQKLKLFYQELSDLLHMFDSLGSGMLSEYDLQIDDRAATTVILTSGGYPDSYDKGSTSLG